MRAVDIAVLEMTMSIGEIEGEIDFSSIISNQ